MIDVIFCPLDLESGVFGELDLGLRSCICKVGLKKTVKINLHIILVFESVKCLKVVKNADRNFLELTVASSNVSFCQIKQSKIKRYSVY